MNNSKHFISSLGKLNLSLDEARLYIELLKQPSTHLRLSRVTGINRTKVYRLAAQLEKRSLVARRTDDRGMFLVAADPATLEVELITQEETLKQQRNILTELIPALSQAQARNTKGFAIHTYEGVDGFKQMLWHELKTKEEFLAFGNGELERLVPDRRWTEQQRARTKEAGYHIREIHNPGTKKNDFTQVKGFDRSYTKRIIPAAAIAITQQTVIYNDTVAIYNWRNEQKVGIEIISNSYASMMRQIFEHYWRVAESIA